MKTKVVLKDAKKKFTLDQDKIIAPQETVKRFKQKLHELNLDILDQTIRIDNGRLDIPVYFSECGKDALKIIKTKKQMGKGATPAQAEASAVMELAERYSFFSFYQNSANFVEDTWENLKDQAIPFDLIAKSVHDTSDELGPAKKIFAELPLKWCPAYNLTAQKELLIPMNWFYTINEFNGPAAGNCQEEALSQGICEIVERHVSALVSRNRLKVPTIRPESAKDPMVKNMLQKYHQAGIKLFLSDFSLDTGIPTVGILAYDPNTFPAKSEIIWTAGTTPDPEKALSRALTETAQLAGDFNSGSNYLASGLPKFTNLKDADFLTHPDKMVDLASLPNLSNSNIKNEVENLISALNQQSMEVIIVNTTHPLLQVPSFYTIIPGAYFKERALGTSVAMFSAKIITETQTPEKAIRELHKMEKLLSAKYYLQFYQGTCHLALNNPANARCNFQKALDLEPAAEDLPSIYSYLGICFKEMGEYHRALEMLEQGEQYDSERTDIYNLMGFCYFMLKDHERAIRCFKKVIKLDPSSGIDYANLASNYRDIGNKAKAIHYYQIALEIDPDIQFAKDNLAKLLS